MTANEINKGEVRDFKGTRTSFCTYPIEQGGSVHRTSKYRCIGTAYDPGECGMEVRAEPVPNIAKPPSAAYCWFSRKEWLMGEVISTGKDQ